MNARRPLAISERQANGEAAIADDQWRPCFEAFVDTLCRQLNVDAWAFLNCGSRTYASLEEIPEGTADLMAETLSALSRAGQVPLKLRGYKEDWCG